MTSTADEGEKRIRSKRKITLVRSPYLTTTSILFACSIHGQSVSSQFGPFVPPDLQLITLKQKDRKDTDRKRRIGPRSRRHFTYPGKQVDGVNRAESLRTVASIKATRVVQLSLRWYLFRWPHARSAPSKGTIVEDFSFHLFPTLRYSRTNYKSQVQTLQP